MVTKRVDAGGTPKRRRPPATSPHEREIYLQSLAFDLVEQRLLNNTASAQEITYFLKAGSERDRLERERLHQENLLTESKIRATDSAVSQEELLRQAMAAFTDYRGDTGVEDL